MLIRASNNSISLSQPQQSTEHIPERAHAYVMIYVYNTRRIFVHSGCARFVYLPPLIHREIHSQPNKGEPNERIELILDREPLICSRELIRKSNTKHNNWAERPDSSAPCARLHLILLEGGRAHARSHNAQEMLIALLLYVLYIHECVHTHTREQ
jgi:hypothetical protein